MIMDDLHFKEKKGAHPIPVHTVEDHEEPLGELRRFEDENNELRKELELGEERIKLLKKELKQANKLATLGTMGAGVAHELNNPLTVISAEADEILDSIVAGRLSAEQTVVSVKNIKQCAERMRCLIDYIRQYIRRDEDTSWSKIDINVIVENALLILKPQMLSQGIELKLNLSKPLPQIWGHKTKLGSIFQNLLSNAKDSFDDLTDTRNRQIKIETTFVATKEIIITLSDNGCGISENIKEKIFDPFFSTKQADKGTGLGLAMTIENIKEHRGTLYCDSKENVGSKFTISLPLERRGPNRKH